MDLDSLYLLVTESIRRAEMLEELKAPGVGPAYLAVSLIEEKIAELLPPADPEGAISRRGAVRAALTAKDFRRAQVLATHFAAEEDVDDEVKTEFGRLAEEAARCFCEEKANTVWTIMELVVSSLKSIDWERFHSQQETFSFSMPPSAEEFPLNLTADMLRQARSALDAIVDPNDRLVAATDLVDSIRERSERSLPPNFPREEPNWHAPGDLGWLRLPLANPRNLFVVVTTVCFWTNEYAFRLEQSFCLVSYVTINLIGRDRLLLLERLREVKASERWLPSTN